MRPQRDLFTGSVLGIPDVNTHVGSVIHAFETMATQRDSKKSVNRPNTNARRRSENGGAHRISLPTATHIYSETDTLTNRSCAPTIVAHREYFIEKPIYETGSNYRLAQQQQQQTSINSNQTRIPVINKKRDNLDTKAITIEYRTISEQANKKHHNNANLFPIIGMTPTEFSPRSTSSASSAAVEEANHNLENDFIRGSTVSQSFIKNLKSSRASNRTYEQSVMKITKHPPPPLPNSTRKNAITTLVPAERGSVPPEVHKRTSSDTVLSVNKIERHTKARSSGDVVISRVPESKTRARSRSKSNERRKTYTPGSLDRAEL